MTSRGGVTVTESSEPNLLARCAQQVFFPAGILGFSSCHHYKLDRFLPDDGSESPFYMLNALDQDLAFPLIHPASISLDYIFPASPELLTTLGAVSSDELVPLLIVTVRDRIEEITVNLQGPVIVNPTSCLGMQLVIEQYPLRHPLLAPVDTLKPL
jgi:flagellar assembly factor FliW